MSNKVVIFVVRHFKTNFPVTSVIICGCLTCWFTMNSMQMLKWQQMKIKVSWTKRNITEVVMAQRDTEMKHKFTDRVWDKCFEYKIFNQSCNFFLLLHAAMVSLCLLLLCFNNPLCSPLLCVSFIEILNLRGKAYYSKLLKGLT